MLDNSEYDFSKPVNSNLTLVASYKDAFDKLATDQSGPVKPDENSDEVKTQ